MPDPHRVAIYYAPDATDPLWAAGNTWLGRDPERNAATPQPPNLPPLTTNPARYGFHATLKPPMHLATPFATFLSAAQSFAATLKTFPLPPLAVTQRGPFLALTPTTPSPALQSLADRCVTELDPHRLPEPPEQIATRAQNRPPRQLAHLARWGYPLVFKDWQFHMTLSNPLDPPTLATLAPQARSHFAQPLTYPRNVTSIAIFTQPTPHASFTLTHRLSLFTGT